MSNSRTLTFEEKVDLALKDSKALRLELKRAQRRIAQLEKAAGEGIAAALNTDGKTFTQGINQLEMRPYTARRSVDKWECGVTVTGLNQTIELARQIDLGLENRYRIEMALRNGDPLEFQPGRTYVTGAITGKNLPLNITGAGLDSVIVQMENSSLFDFRTSQIKQTKVQVERLCIEAGRHITGDHAAFRLAPYTTGGDTSGYMRDVTIRRRNDLEAEYGIGVWLENPNEFDFSNVRYLGRLNPQGTAFRLRGNKANISFAFYNCKAYDCVRSFDFESSSVPGLEGIMMTKCDAVGTVYGFSFRSTAPNDQYLPPQIDLSGCHANIVDNANGKAFEFVNYAQVNVNACSAYMGGENQTGFYIDTCSESNFVANRAYNNGDGAVTGFYVGPNNVYCNFISTRGALGEGNPLFHLSEGAAYTTIETANDITNPDPILDEGVATRIENVYKGNTGRTLSERITAYERTWPFRTQDEQLYVRRYPSDDPNFPDRLTVESRQPFLNAYTSEAPAELWWKLWESLPATNAGNRDFLHFSAQVGRWENLGAEDGDIQRQLMDIIITTREGINVQWSTEGNISTSGIVIFNDGGKASVWMCLKSTTHLQSGSVSVLHRVGTPMPRQLWPDGLDEDYYTAETGVRPVASQPFSSGNIVFDSRQPGTYKPLSWRKKTGLLSRMESAATAPAAEDILPGYCMQVYDPAKQEIVTWYHDPDDADKPIKATMRKPVPVENYTLFLTDKTGGVTKFPLWNTRDQRYEYIDIATAREWLGLNWIYQTSWAQVFELLDSRYVRNT